METEEEIGNPDENLMKDSPTESITPISDESSLPDTPKEPRKSKKICKEDKAEETSHPFSKAKRASKNALQFFAGLVKVFAKENNESFTSSDMDLIAKLKKKPNILNFSRLFHTKGPAYWELSHFFQGKWLWHRVLISKIRDHEFKVVYRDTINVLRRGYLERRLTRLTN
jgi:hypothetical protein